MSKRILVIDSTRVIRLLLHLHLAQAGHQVIAVEDARKGWETLQALQQEVPEIIFLGVHVPGEEDLRVLHSIVAHAWLARTTVIVVVSREDSARVQRALVGRPIQYLVKPFRIQDALALASPAANALPVTQTHDG